MVNGLQERRNIKRRRSPSLTPGHRNNEADGGGGSPWQENEPVTSTNDDDHDDVDLDITSGDESLVDERELAPDSTSEPS